MVFVLREDSESLGFPFGKNQEEKGDVIRTVIPVRMEKKRACGIESDIKGEVAMRTVAQKEVEIKNWFHNSVKSKRWVFLPCSHYIHPAMSLLV